MVGRFGGGPRVATMATMKQLGPGFNLSTKKTRKRRSLKRRRVMPWAVLVQMVEPYYSSQDRPSAARRRRCCASTNCDGGSVRQTLRWKKRCVTSCGHQFAQFEGFIARLADETSTSII